MIPLRDSIRSSTFPIVNIPAKFFNLLEDNPANVAGMVMPFFTSIFLHGGWMHFIGNMWFLWIFGDNVEDSMGRGRYIIFYLLAGLGASIVHALFNADSNLPTVGASGAISGIMGAYMILYPRGKVLTLIPFFILFTVNIRALVFILIWIGIQIVQGVVSLGLPGHVGGVAWWAHIGGFVIGALLIFFFRKRRPQNYFA
jgi:membrane associated rhomboid family serine protease